ncbi:16S rRNA (uracil(1498)-N(3))-methyltransferase [Vallitalea sp.]|jgi:16S rRNA (uracil1498-N3)-methyltransferase|uniref:16S rRNA (uracil(1498)-N(3))-methyltransferase n=1 Tax=Vallitalea sp. TaxID=1882829 RepID=UPI0025E87ABD|nr:16S rRNA (uracil(1498)-N(3))-methyltransferase [Vallitalea sp.]MCT4687151.1 16S rRNA (uracil(1498)-N(3))-methyltransferase [Vallitalea sp.]
MHRFFVEPNQIIEDEISIVGGDVKHIKNVLRMNKNDEIIICDGHSNDYYCIINNIEDEYINTKIVTKKQSITELKTKIYLFQALPKQAKMELIVQKAVELGVYEIIPVITERSVVKINKQNGTKKLARWNKVAQSAAKQSKRGIIPVVNEIMNFEEAIEYSKQLDTIIVPYENANNITETKEFINNLDCKRIGVFIGPEGGFSLNEIEEAKSSEAIIITLGKRILRTETAGLAILSLLMFQLEEE